MKMRAAATLSVALHIVMVVALCYQWSSPYKMQDDNSLVIDFVSIGKVSKAPVLGPTPIAKPKTEIAPPAEEPKVEEQKPKEEPQKEETQPKPEEAQPEKTKEAVQEAPVAKELVKVEKTTPQKIKQEPKKELKKDDKKKPAPKTEKKTEASKDTAKDDQSSSGPQQRASSIGDVITTSEIAYIKQRIKDFWRIPSGLVGSDIQIRVNLSLDRQGKIIGDSIVDPDVIEDEAMYQILRSSIAAAINNPELDFSELSEKTLRVLSKQKLELIFNPKDF